MFSQMGDMGSGAGKGGGSGGSIRDAGGAYGKMEAAREEEYFHKLKQAQLKALKQQLVREQSHHEEQAKHHQDVDEIVNPEDLEKFRKQYAEESRRGAPAAQTAFYYAHALIKSTKEDVRTGIYILESLLKRVESDMPKRDYVYYLAIAHTRIKEYDRALEYINLLLSAESDNHQALDLKELIEQRMKRDGLVGLALTFGFGGAAILGVAAAAVMAIKKK
uniref:ATP synthase F1 subunit epsilon n=1 Tax=Meloidogyne javanica TaxID=6303 RepID=A0A915M8U5_MELJA